MKKAEITNKFVIKNGKTFLKQVQKLKIDFNVGDTIVGTDKTKELTISNIIIDTENPIYEFHGTSEWIYVYQQHAWTLIKL